MGVKVVLFGPQLNLNNPRIYGSGEGGYTRNMRVYISCFDSEELEIIPCYHTIRGQFRSSFLTPVFRIILDVKRLLTALSQKDIDFVHILGQYRGAVWREVIVVILANILHKKVVYEIKAGAFGATYRSGTKLYKSALKFIISNSSVVLTEGLADKSLLSKLFRKDSFHFPNVVPWEEIPKISRVPIKQDCIKLLYVGYAYEGKGVYELLQAFEVLRDQGIRISLTFAGGMDDKFQIHATKSRYRDSLCLAGKCKHETVINLMLDHDVYVYPSRHEGEGHNNSINEALMCGMVVCSTRNGFLNEFLSDNNSFEIRHVTKEEISKILLQSIYNWEEAYARSIKGRALILESFNTQVAREYLFKIYKSNKG